MYYYYSIAMTIIIFILLQIKEYNSSKKKNKIYNLFNFGNIGILFILYIISTVILYVILETNYINNRDDIKGEKIEFNQELLKNITDNDITVGFSPYYNE